MPSTDPSVPDAPLDPDALDDALAARFGGDDGERRVVVRQATDLADAGKHRRDRGHPLTVEEVLSNLADAPAGSSLVDRWNWWMGALEVAYGGYEPFQVRRFRRE
ncbi:MAG: hypothetical protein ABEJ22_09255 [Haloferacaceae archaeon]